MAEQYIYHKKVRNAPIRRKLDRRFVRWVMAASFVGSIVAFGYVYSARCHFEAISLGYATQEMRVEIEQQTEQRRQLEVERERELAPDKLEQRARRIGLCTPQYAVGAVVEPGPLQVRPGAR